MTYYEVKTARDLIPNYAEYVKQQIEDAYIAGPIPKDVEQKKKKQKPPNPLKRGTQNRFLQRYMLRLLSEKTFSSSEIMREIWTRTDKQWKPNQEVLSSLLGWLHKEGYVETQKECYTLTEKGEALRKEQVRDNRKFVEEKFLRVNRERTVLDCACGGGADIQNLKEMGFKNVVGSELSGKFIKTAKNVADGVLKSDMHCLGFRDGSFGVVFSAHTIEHAYYPAKLLHEFWRILKPDGLLFVILPYPDAGHEDDFHVAKYELGTNILDQGKTVIKFFMANGFHPTIVERSRGLVQEPLLWLQFRKRLFKRGKPYKPWEDVA